MSLSLPYFKMDVIDWLKSEKIEAMSSAAVGGYIMLLCEAWTRPSCSLPSARLALMKLARWTGTEDEFSQVLHCFIPFKDDKTRVINVRLKREWDETQARMTVLREAGKKGALVKQALKAQPAPVRTPRSRPIRTPMDTDFEQFWQAYPKKIGKKDALKAWLKATDKPAMVDILHAVEQSKKSEQWTKNNGQFIPNPSTWLNQGRWTDQPLTNGHAALLTCPHHPSLTFTDTKAKDTHDFIHHPKYVG